MNTNKLKRFATEARTKIKQGVVMMMRQWGFDAEGNIIEEPIKIDGGTIFRGAVIGGEDVYYRWEALRNRIATAGLKQVYEEAAYTWFNRFVAIKILSKNGLLEGFLDNVEEKPQILSQARRNAFPLTLTEDERRKALEMAGDHEREFELFTFLITSVCHSTPILAKCFGKINDYTELLLPRSILTQGDFIDMLNNEEYICDDDYRQAELIGWLYQFYIAERKDEVFASFKSGKKATKDEIPAATQIFTPNWIVKYMVQNTIGRIYLDNFPDSELVSDWKYYIKSANNRTEDDILKIENPEELTLGDFACGSGHILVEGFDILYSIYKEQYASDREACESILKYNLVGIDIDTRAKQLAQFAILMKVCKRVPEMVNCDIMPQVFDMPDPLSDKEMEMLHETLHHFFLGGTQKVIDETYEALGLLQQAQDLGSIMKFDVSDNTIFAIETALKNVDFEMFPFIPHLQLLLVLTKKYASLCMNPPYMGSSNMNATLSNYVGRNYEEGKADLMTVFMLKAIKNTMENGLWAMINLPSWMFLPSFESLRDILIKQQGICSLNYNGRGIFGSDFGSVSFVIRNNEQPLIGSYRKLFSVQGSVRSIDEIKQNFEDKNFGAYWFNQIEFLKVPGTALAFWLPMSILNSFSKKVSDIATAKKGLSTGNNNLYLRLWHEVELDKSTYESEDYNNDKKWYPINKGGSYRKWYGNNEYVIDWKNNGEDIRAYSGSVIRNPGFYLKESLTWTMLSASCFGIRYSKKGKIFEGAGPSLFADPNSMYYILAFLCSKLGNMVIRALNPTINININDVLNLPLRQVSSKEIETISRNTVAISIQDWDAHETSWDFQTNEILSLLNRGLGTITVGWDNEEGTKYSNLDLLVEEYKAKWNNLHSQLHQNEEELNRQFIEIYGLQDELTPDVPLEEITILQQGEISIENNEIVWHPDVIMKQLISYAVGCMMGRYSIDMPGLILANQGDGLDEYNEKVPNSRFIADEDGILPILPEDAPFTDNIRQRMIEFISTVFGRENQVENLNFIENALGKSLGDYLIKDFWKDHKKMYQNRPIYWLFTSKKGAFQCITYMHRMDEYTLERIRQKYLLPYISHLETKVQALQAKESLTTAESRQLTKLKTTIEECREYHDRLHQYSQQNIAFDLDDGVVKNYTLFGDVVAKLK